MEYVNWAIQWISILNDSMAPVRGDPGAAAAGPWRRRRHYATLIPPSQPLSAKKQPSMMQEEKFMDEDVFLDETLLSTNEESLILHDIDQCQSLATCLSKWTRPPLHADYVSQSRSAMFQKLLIDYIIGESHNDLLPNSFPLMHRISFPSLLLPLPHLEFHLL
ncbi:hypothetical protein Fmac_003303 [Flemingia macrophylla]|uniref:Uncharacterized protein n=1 Tax=Flemingia macrophylla TaxID=520843 RepID=A0ABD1NMD2_9FABA